MWMQARWVEAAASSRDGAEFARRLETNGILMRIDPQVEPQVWRGAIASRLELGTLRTVERVVRGRVLSIGSRTLSLDSGELSAAPDEVFVDCTAAGVPAVPTTSVFAPGRITLDYITVGTASLSAATLGMLESFPLDDGEKNRLSPAVTFSGNVRDLLTLALTGITGAVARSAVPELSKWHDLCRLNFAAGATARRSDPQIAAARGVLTANIGAALANHAGLPAPARR